ncbi:hypothetical protein [Methylobacter tundripaludum]|nr:hypothetical protein [Methylobacter tundripaludum]
MTNRFLAVAGLFMATGVAGAEEPQVTPYRSTVSNPAVLPVPGMPEIELGGMHSAGGSEQQRDPVPFLAKYAFNSDWGVMVGADLLCPRHFVGGRHRSERLWRHPAAVKNSGKF